MDKNLATATLAGGCFWCLEAAYQQVCGVVRVVNGYAGGTRPNPTYESVHYHNSGEAETVEITYKPTIISYSDILDIFGLSMIRPRLTARAMTWARSTGR